MADLLSSRLLALSLIPALLGYLIINLPWEKEVTFGFKRELPRDDEELLETGMHKRSTLHFTSHGERIHAWLYVPAAALKSKPPIVLMSHGLGSQKDIGLPKVAAGLAKEGVASLLFDYRSFGGSDGEPRQNINWQRHLEDVRAAVDYIQGGALDEVVDPQRLVLWGMSYGGGHTVVTAAQLGKRVKAAIPVAPFLSAAYTRERQRATHNTLKMLRMLAVALSDMARSRLGLPAAYLKLMVRKGTGELGLGQINPPDYDLFMSSIGPKPLGGWKNLAPGRMIFSYTAYNPLAFVPNVTCPTLFIAGSRDEITPASIVKEAAKQVNGTSRYVEYDATHFTILSGTALQQMLHDITAFLKDNGILQR